MRTISRTAAFKRDLKREKAGRHSGVLDTALPDVVAELANDRPLARRRRDHGLAGKWRDCRECHVRPDLLLIYRKPDDDTLQLVRLGSHSALGL